MKWLLTGLVAVGLTVGLVGAAAAQQNGLHHRGQTGVSTVDTVEQAQRVATDYLAEIGLSNLAVGEVVPFTNNYYVVVIDPTTGNGAFELIVHRSGGYVRPEPGPTLMWNTEYGPTLGAKGIYLQGAMMGSSMMGNPSGHGQMDRDMLRDGSCGQVNCPQGTGYQAAAEPLAEPLTTDAAVAVAQSWLTEQALNATATGAVAFPGYVTVKIERDGEIIGVLSVQTSTGAVWQHLWYGAHAS
jgi:hypothetical protein